MNDLEAFAKLVQALDPWRQQLIFIGGWAHRLHRLDPRANALDYQPVFTRDTDLAFANREVIAGDIKTTLIAHGFQEVLGGDHTPPAAHYTLGNAGSGFYAEFLTPLAGSGTRRNGKPDATLLKAGIVAQKIRHLDILLVDPWVITLDPKNGVPLSSRTDILVAHPLCFMVQKFLIQNDRPAAKKAQDMLYVYDTIELFGALLPEMHAHWVAHIKPALGKSSEIVQERVQDTFLQVNDLTRTAARIPTDRNLSAERIQATCAYAFSIILG
ncbi:GSU2403 family nucleotidyltransferase fold protein [Variovorax sp. RT4R15]|uniref:GSU2403 family nucleotidyltransferase fold protein n=1 Tax=Variovorax sp. RT4R15 TaxID=3443737 RepID=UPI003F4780CC